MLAQFFFKIGKKKCHKKWGTQIGDVFLDLPFVGLRFEGSFYLCLHLSQWSECVGATCSLEPISAIPGMCKYIPSLKLTFSPLKIGLFKRPKKETRPSSELLGVVQHLADRIKKWGIWFSKVVPVPFWQPEGYMNSHMWLKLWHFFSCRVGCCMQA